MTTKPSKDSALKRRFGPTALITGASDGIGRAFLPPNWLNTAST